MLVMQGICGRFSHAWVMRLESGGISFPNLAKHFNPLLQVVVLIWKNSKYYNTPARLVALMRQICNLLISRACQYVSGEEIFRLIDDDEVNVVVEQLRSILLVGGAFKRAYLDARAQVAKECPQNPWRVQNNAIFVRLDRFLERCYDMLDFTQAVQHFSRLSKTDIGNTNGERLTSLLHDMAAATAIRVGSKQHGRRCSDRMFGSATTSVVNVISPPSPPLRHQRRISTAFSLTSILDGHLSCGFSPAIQDVSSKIVQSAIQVQDMVTSTFLPSAVKIMCNWNMRDLRNIFQGLCLSKPDYYTDPSSLLRLYVHGTQRVYTDRFVTEDEVATFHTKFVDIVKNTLGSDVQPAIDALGSCGGGNIGSAASAQSSPLVYTNFVHGSMDRAYLPLASFRKLRKASSPSNAGRYSLHETTHTSRFELSRQKSISWKCRTEKAHRNHSH